MQLQEILDDLQSHQQSLHQHGVFSQLTRPEALQDFMQWHVFAVWDFMSLVKRLQCELTSVTVPWMPARFPLATRLINEIVLAEESDETADGRHVSHFEMYLEAMQEIGADTAAVERFVQALRDGVSTEQALRTARAPLAVQEFVKRTLRVAQHGQLAEVLGYFFFGREDVIPSMFSSLLQQWGIDEEQAPTFVYYLQRHIELDGDSHGPAALKIIDEITRENETARESLHQAGLRAVQARKDLWDALSEELRTRYTGFSKAS